MWNLNEPLYRNAIDSSLIYQEKGRITKSIGLVYEASLSGATVGSICEIQGERGGARTKGEVVGFRGDRVLIMPFGAVQGIGSRSWVQLIKRTASFRVGPQLLGRILDPEGNPLDGKGPIEFSKDGFEERSLYASPADPLKRARIDQPIELGVRSIDGLITCGKGQRVGVMAGSGVGKSVLMGVMAKNTSADINVIALLGERGREVREFVENELGEEGIKRSVVIVATSDSSPVLRTRAAYLSATIAEYFRDRGDDVLLLMDSVTRFCMSQREIGLSMGEPPATKGYTPSVFSTLPKLLERAGTGENGGSITGIFTVLVEGDDLDDPIADSARSYLDGHIVLSRRLAERGHYPAVDVLQSSSRVLPSIVPKEQIQWVNQIREWMSLYNEAEDLINIGAYTPGSNPRIDIAIGVNERIQKFLRQPTDDRSSLPETVAGLHALIRVGEAIASSSAAAENADTN